MAARSTSCHNCSSSDTKGYDTRFIPGSVRISVEYRRCNNCGHKFPVYYDC